MIKLAYNLNGLRNLDLEIAIKEVSRFKYSGVELSLHRNHIHPDDIIESRLSSIRKVVSESNLTISCLATGCDNLLSDEPFEPSLIHPEKSGRNKRIDLLLRSLEIANTLGIPVMNFASGRLKSDVEKEEAEDYLCEGIRCCLEKTGNIIMAIEPEPDMFIETTEQAIDIIKKINSQNFKLNLDIGHVYCCENFYYEKIKNALPYTHNIHIEDIRYRIHHHEIPGTGEIDFAPIFSHLKAVGYDKYVAVELYHHVDVWEKALGDSYTYLSKILNKVYST